MLTVNTKGLGKLRTSRHGHKSRKAISNVITTILLVVVGIILVGVVFGISSGILGHAAPATGAQFTSATISGETGLMSISVQNTGSAAASSEAVAIYGPSGQVTPSSITCNGHSASSTTGKWSITVSPGQTFSCSATGSFTSGVTYTIQVTLGYSSSSQSAVASDNVVAS